ncbi:MAG TPA: LL-diaminopimelate aminotransferase [Bacillota bacterium]|nr:LL-diaminopimelate aminotransferase [Peptococcaceae bacterium MAG4]NLW37482.1 LL-diaminopimelate aminotransferase [Peptococcaceae bacterium]HPZ43751.1 LL-diaminopimelate aminotransferase [Bacillota bacterium]HQD76172.1 LL-diaminopimelate aminotransferase [Bacillota bacterium]HUM58874.1 LL-diaminopimelate aminotransferase [Bacillota bacterium]
MKIVEAQRICNLPPYLFARIEKLIAAKKEAGVDVISLGIGDPDRPTPVHIIETLVREAYNPANHQYPSSVGMLTYRKAVAQWYQNRFGVELNPETEVVSLLGSKEGIAHISWCYLNPGDTVLVPDPGYPVYSGGAILAGAEPYYLPLKPENGYLIDFKSIPRDVAKRAKIIFVNYPNNPTGAVAGEAFYRELIDFAREYDILVCHDAAYSDVSFDGYKPPSFLQFPGAKEVGIEFHSVSKTYNMTGWRVGWAAGNARVVEALGRLKSNIDSGVFQAIQYAAAAGLTGPQDIVAEQNKVYQERRDILIEGLNSLGWNLEKPKATFYVWAPVPRGYTSDSFAELVLDKAGVVITPGTGYGQNGAGYFRMALTIDKERIKEALERIKNTIGTVTF